MSIVLIVLLVLGLIGCLAIGVMAMELHRSDAAGNGLTEAFLVLGSAATWLVVVVAVGVSLLQSPEDAAPGPWLAPAGLALACPAQAIGLVVLCRLRQRGLLRSCLQLCVPLVPLAFLLHAAWRGGLPVPWQVATWGCGAVVVAGSALALGSRAKQRAHRAAVARTPGPESIVWPALLVQEGELVRVLRERSQLEAMPRDLVERLRQPVIIDSNCTAWVVRELRAADQGGKVSCALTRDPARMSFASIRDAVLRVAPLHDDTARDAEVRRLVAMQSSVTALSFVLPR
jgi:hypothetical protein